MQMDGEMRFCGVCVFFLLILLTSTSESKEMSSVFLLGESTAHPVSPINGITPSTFRILLMSSNVPSELPPILTHAPESLISVAVSPSVSAIIPIPASIPELSPILTGVPEMPPVSVGVPTEIPVRSEGNPPTTHAISSSVPPSSPPSHTLDTISSSMPPSSPPSPTLDAISLSAPPSLPPSPTLGAISSSMPPSSPSPIHDAITSLVPPISPPSPTIGLISSSVPPISPSSPTIHVISSSLPPSSPPSPTIHVISSSVPPSSPPSPTLPANLSSMPPSAPPSHTSHAISSSLPPSSPPSPTTHTISTSVSPSSLPSSKRHDISSLVSPSSLPSPANHAISSSVPPSSPPSHLPTERKPFKGLSPSVESPAPSTPVREASMPPSHSSSAPSVPPVSSQGPAVVTAPSSYSPINSSSKGVHGKFAAASPGLSGWTRSFNGSPHSNGPASSPSSLSSPVGKNENGPTAAAPQMRPSHLPVPASSPKTHGDTNPPSFSPASPENQSPKRTTWTPASAPIKSFQQHIGKSGPFSSPPSAFPPVPAIKNQTRHDSPSAPQSDFPPMQSPSSSKSPPRAVASPSSGAPSSQISGVAQSPGPSHSQSSTLSPSGQIQRPIHTPSPSPFRSSHTREGAPLPAISKALPPLPAPMPLPTQALPPPPPNLDCMPLSCMDPLTNSPPGLPCLCVRPIKVGLRLSVALYTFFPLVSDLAKEISFGTSMKQSQVRIMGANADEQPEKTIVLIDLVPFGKKFDNSTVFLISEKIWHKQVGIQTSVFGEYDVLYVNYPGLPPSPPLPPSDINIDDASYGNGRNSGAIHPLGVDVRKHNKKFGGSVIAIIILSSVIALALLIGAVWFAVSTRSDQDHLPTQTPRTSFPPFSKTPGIGPAIFGSKPSSASGSFSSSMATYTGTAKTFSAMELERATTKFDESRIIGEGGFGCVYEGTLDDGTRVAVKVLKREDQQGSREFLAEVEMLSRLHHRNLVKLIGICTEENLRCLVYELIPNGSVESHLHGADKETAPLDWSSRMKIALGSARGLAYLHEDSSPRVIHRDFKSSNILLEHDFTPKVSDFGLARTALEGNEHISTRVMGTFGYVAPEYAMTGHLLVKSDVYSYGVVLLELLTGRKPVDMQQPPGQENLVTWARPLLASKEGLEMIIDPTLGPNFPMDDIAKVAAIASMCVQPEVAHRPFMGEVVQALKLVCSEIEGHRASGSSCQDLSTQDPESRTNNVLAPNTERVISASEIFSTGLTRDTSGSFRRHSSSGPLTTRKKGYFWQKIRGFSKGSSSEHGRMHGFKDDTEGGQRWP